MVRGPDSSRGTSYEERVTIWCAADFVETMNMAEAEAREYLDPTGDRSHSFVGLVQAFIMSEPPGHGAEVFSLMRYSDLAPEPYLTRFFDTRAENGTIYKE